MHYYAKLSEIILIIIPLSEIAFCKVSYVVNQSHC